MGQKQHVDIHRKLDLRRRLLAKAVPGAAYVPFIGDGDIAVELYTDRQVFGSDIDAERVATAASRLDGSTVVVADADGPWPFDHDPDLPFAVADLDSYAYPYHAFREWWAKAPKADRVVVFGTDAQRLAIRKASATAACTLPDGTKQRLFGEKAERQTQARDIFNKYVTKYLRPWLNAHCEAEGWRVVDWSHFLRDSMVYWGAVLERADASPASPTTPAPRKGRGFAGVADQLLDLVADGATVAEAAAQLGYTARTAQLFAKKNPDYRQALDDVLDARERGIDPKFNDTMRAEFLDKLREGKRLSTAARAVGIDPSTVRRHRIADRDFDALVVEAADEADDLVEDALFEAAINGNVTAAQVWLYNRRPERWTDKRNRATEHGTAAPGADDGAVAGPSPEDVVAAMLERGGTAAADLLGQLDDLFAPDPEIGAEAG